MNCAAKALLRCGERFLVLKHVPSRVRASLWENPGGMVDPGETPEEAVVREIYEETNIRASVECVISEERLSSGCSRWTRILFLCTCDTDEVHLSREHTDFAWLTLFELEHLEDAPRVRDDLAVYKMFLTKKA